MINIFWFRRDLRLIDNKGLSKALEDGLTLPIFIFDTDILDSLPDNDRRVSFIYNQIQSLKNQLNEFGSDLLVFFDKPLNVFKYLTSKYEISTVYTNRDYEPYALIRDRAIQNYLTNSGVEFSHSKDHLILEYNEVLKDDGSPYTVFTPYSKKWKLSLSKDHLKPHVINNDNFFQFSSPLIELETMGFIKQNISDLEFLIDQDIINSYSNNRDFPYLRGTSRLGTQLRFGTISIRELTKLALKLNETYLNELIWREFYSQILFQFPHVVTSSFKPKYDKIPWLNSPDDINSWKEGKTGYPIVDAGMRELNSTGFMHNRVRMITASFLVKHLLVDWRIGEAYFAEKLNDFELASNNGGWQWAAGTGCDAAPYFRVFNPYLQTKKFDSDLKYVRKWVPEFDDPFTYPKPIVEHSFARNRAIATYKAALS